MLDRILGRMQYTWQVMGASWQVLKQDRELILFTLLSSAACLLVMASFAIPMWQTGAFESAADEMSEGGGAIYYVLLFLFYFANFFVITFFNSAIVSCAIKRLGGGDPTFRFGIEQALQRLPQIFAWALLAATVGTILRIIEDRSEFVGRIVAGVLGMAWTVVTFLVVPVLVVERKGPFAALKRSTSLLRKTWGEQLISTFSFEGLFFLLGLPGILLIIAGIAVGMGVLPLGILIAGAGVIYLVGLGLIQSTLHAIFKAALYAYAETGAAPGLIPERLLQGAMHRSGR